MRGRRTNNTIARFTSCIFMMLALAWLTVSFPVVYSAQKIAQQKEAATTGSSQNNDDKADNPFANTNEEKTSANSSSLSEEYLHDTHSAEYHLVVLSTKYTIEHHQTYIAFYGDLESPPPDIT
jgi:hypothetical protein